MRSSAALLARYFGVCRRGLRRMLDLRSSHRDVKMQYAQKHSLCLDTRTMPGRRGSCLGPGNIRTWTEEACGNGRCPQGEPFAHAESKRITLAFTLCCRKHFGVQDDERADQLRTGHEPGDEHQQE